MQTAEYIELEDRFSARNYDPLNIILEYGDGAWVYDIGGKRYLDCLSSYSALNHGHRHPRIVEAMKQQLDRLSLTSRAFRNDQFGPFCQELCELTGYDMTLVMNSGAEAVETALKAARKWAYTRRMPALPVDANLAEIIAFEGNFHGRTITIISFSTELQYRQGFGPFTPGFKNVAYGDLREFEASISPTTVAVLIEPIQGESGIRLPPDGFLRQVREVCTNNNLLLIADEIQTGLGRTGKLFGCDHENVRADIMIVGKALAGGMYPVSAVLSSREILGVFEPGDHGSTFGGNPLGMAVARAALKVLVEEGLIENSDRMGRYFMSRLAELPKKHIQQIRGRGLLIGVEIKSQSGPARPFCEALAREGILCKETHGQVIRFAPPLIINSEAIDWAMHRIEQVLTNM
jgi:ornithine--oxo-acid transaminase